MITMYKQIEFSGQLRNSPWVPEWAQDFAVSGRNEIPNLRPLDLPLNPLAMNSLWRHKAELNCKDRLLHLYANDSKLLACYKNPKKLLEVASLYSACITPDFSILHSMPEHQRIRSVIHSREIGAYLQEHGLQVIPNIRWAEQTDLNFIFDGLPKNSVIAISTQTVMRNALTRQIFLEGLPKVVDNLHPTKIILYGSVRNLNLTELMNKSELLHFNTDLFRVFTERSS